MQLPSNSNRAASPAWSQEEAIAFECARECITHLMAFYTAEIHAEETQPNRDEHRLSSLRAERTQLASEGHALHLSDNEAIARIRKEYGALIRSRGAGHINDGEKETKL